MKDVFQSQRNESASTLFEKLMNKRDDAEAPDEKPAPTRAQRRAMARFAATRERKGTRDWRKSQEEQRRIQQRVALLTDDERRQLGKELGLNG